MNSKSKVVLLAGTALVALLLLFPPWDYFDPNIPDTSVAGYHFFLSPPDPKKADFRPKPTIPEHVIVRMDLVRLTIQLLIIIPMALGLAVLFRTQRSLITVLVGIFLFVPPLLAVLFLAWMLLISGMEYGTWSL